MKEINRRECVKGNYCRANLDQLFATVIIVGNSSGSGAAFRFLLLSLMGVPGPSP